MRTTLVVLAVTKMRAGFCIAGVDPATGQWVRPVKAFGSLRLGDISYRDGTPIRPFHLVSFELGKACPRPPHVEDWACDFVRARPEKVGELCGEARRRALESWTTGDVAPVLARHEKSLGMVRPDGFELSAEVDQATGRVDVRLACASIGLARPVPVTDLQVRSLARSGVLRGKLDARSLSSLLDVSQWYVVLGLSREFEGKIWPLVVGLHPVPEVAVDCDYKAP